MINSSRQWTPKKIILLVYDLAVTLVSAFLAIFAFSLSLRGYQMAVFKDLWYLFPLIALPVFYFLGFYDQMWVYASIQQYLLLLAGSTLQTMLVTMLMQLLRRRLPFACYLLYGFFLALFVVGFRVVYRVFATTMRKKLSRRQRSEWNVAGRLERGGHVRVLIVGAGAAGSQIISELQRRQDMRVPVAIIDDNPLTHTYKNQGVPVVGGRESIAQAVRQFEIDEILLAIPSAPPKAVRDILRICNGTKAKVRMIPFLPQFLSGKVLLNNVRDVEIEDLLGRESVQLDMSGLNQLISQRVVLVTGGGGSIGSELARQIASFHPARLILLDIYENNLYSLEQELKTQYGLGLSLVTIIASVREKDRLEEIFRLWRPDIVFHAAAHKHVPLMEGSPCEAVKNNIMGSWNVASVAGESGVERMILISTDKAVNPTNVMGASKRFAELIMLAMNTRYEKTNYAMVRFGNVLGSNGSVIPLFKRQIETERRVTVTDPEIRRFFMTIPEAVSLVLQAACYASGGEIFVLDMGEAVKIDDLARQLIRLSGYEPDVDIPIQYIGLRPGEKMYEELFLEKEQLDKTSHEKIFVLKQCYERENLKQESKRLTKIIGCEPDALKRLSQELIDDICR